MSYDLVIKGGRVMDGTGLPGFTSDVAVTDGRIVEIGRITGQSQRTIDADGLVVAPGFIDIHTHYDAQILWDPLASSSCWHGFTTMVFGNCGFTIAPAKTEDRTYLLKMLARVEGMSLSALEAGVDWDWTTVPEYLDRLGSRLGVNVAAMIGHSAVRYHVMGEAALERAATEDEIRSMQAVVRQGMAAGAAGFSTSQQITHLDGDERPIPSRQATADEIVALASVLKEFNAGAIELVPKSLLTGLSEEDRELLVRLAVESGRFVNWNEFHFRWDDPERWRDIADFMADAARRHGARLYGVARTQRTRTTFDLVKTVTFDRVPAWKAFMARSKEEKVKALKDRATIEHLVHEMEHSDLLPALRPRWETIYVDRSALAGNQALEGRSLAEIGRERGVHPAEAMLAIASEEAMETRFLLTRLTNEEEGVLADLLLSPHAIVGISDAGAHTQSLCQVDFSTHLLTHWARDEQVISLEDAVRRLTFVPASLMGMRDRGHIQEGLAADLVVFDPEALGSKPQEIVEDLPDGGSRTILKGNGYHYSIVNGQVLLEDGVHTGAFPGRVLRSGRA